MCRSPSPRSPRKTFRRAASRSTRTITTRCRACTSRTARRLADPHSRHQCSRRRRRPPRSPPTSARPSPACSPTFGGKPNLRLVDIDRVEVLRGPQGTLFGANALAGVVRIIPNAPDLQEFEADVGMRGFTTAHSDDESYHVEAAVNIPLVTDRWRCGWWATRMTSQASSTTRRRSGRDRLDRRRSSCLTDRSSVPAVRCVHASRRQFGRHLGRARRADVAGERSNEGGVMHAVQDVTLNSEPSHDARGRRL